MGFGTRTPTSNDPEDPPRNRLSLGGEEGEKQRQAREEFSARVDKEAAEKREAELQAAFDVEAAKDPSLLQTTMYRHIAAQFFRAGYTVGRKDESAEWEGSDPGFEEKDFH